MNSISKVLLLVLGCSSLTIFFVELSFHNRIQHVEGGTGPTVLQKALERTSQRASSSRKDKTVLVTLIDGSVSNVLLPTFLQSVQLVPGDLEKRLLVISIDTEGLYWCLKQFMNCLLYPTPSQETSLRRQLLQSEGDIGKSFQQISEKRKASVRRKAKIKLKAKNNQRETSEKFLSIGWQRVAILKEIVSYGYTALFVDCDMVFFQDPFAYMQDRTSDWLMTVDGFDSEKDPPSTRPNVGFLYVRPTKGSVALLTEWDSRGAESKREQFEFQGAWDATKVKFPGMVVEYLNTDSFPNGCCCGTKVLIREDNFDVSLVPNATIANWVIWHAACVKSMNQKHLHLHGLLNRGFPDAID